MHQRQPGGFGLFRHREWLRHATGAAALLALACLALLSWTPPSSIPRTGAPGALEHVVGYWGASALAALSAPLRARRWLGLVMVGLAGVLEIGQLWVPGRTCQLLDFAGGSAGAVLGIAFATHRSRLGEASETWNAGAWHRARHRLGLALVLAGIAITPVWIAILLWSGLRLIGRLLP